MGIMSVLALLWGVCAYAGTTPANDIYSDSLTIQRSSAEVPGSLEASRSDEQPIESVSDLVESAKPKAKKSARK